MREIEVRAWDEQTKTMTYPNLYFTSDKILSNFSIVM